MTFINDIVAAEEEASKLVADAHAEDKKKIADAEQSRVMKVSETRKKLLEEHETKLTDQKDMLAQIYKKTYDAAHTKDDDAIARAKAAEKKAVTKVVEAILG